MLVIDGSKNMSVYTLEHFRLATALQIPIFIVVTHVDKMDEDMCDDMMVLIRDMKRSLDNTSQILEVRSLDDVFTFSKNIKEDIIPLFKV